MIEFIAKMRHRLFGTVFVWTTDFDGEIRLVTARKTTFGWRCRKISGWVAMNPDGTIYRLENRTQPYVHSWKPAFGVVDFSHVQE